jgi:[pyruvate, water dikinase]-phosphate phosphotransferase / [pyruvate, water dikinase] kinase
MSDDTSVSGAPPRSPLPTVGSPIYVVSGALGANGELLARTVLAQFRVQAPIFIIGHVSAPEDIYAAVERARTSDGCIVHTLVNKRLRALLIERSAERGVYAFDLAGPLLEYLSQRLDQEPLGIPGLYRQQQIAYFRRVEAIEFTVAHDDGKRAEDLPHADIVLMGPSRCGKTPLSMYLAMIGWKVANVPIAPGVEPPALLFEIDKRRIVALQIAPAQLMAHRKWRQQRLGTDEGLYTDRAAVVDELRQYNHFVFRHGFPTLDVTDKPIETSGDEVVQMIARRTPMARFDTTMPT